MTSFLGHNNGPTMEVGHQWRTHCWKKARADLVPHLPIEVLRGRVRRAKELGLDYKTYASVRASTGRDVVGFLFSSNALRAFVNKPKLSDDRLSALDCVTACKRIALVSAPLTPANLLAANFHASLDSAHQAPTLWHTWPQSRERVLAALRGDRLPSDGVLLIGDTELEREWSQAGRLAGYVPAAQYFTGSAS